ncbi:MAG: YigZ family protein [Bacteroidaceae bacterium]|nr:YigZ family protein [Bacteroidaceae bacterium]MBR6170063.1 YigZ family protein [Bacteroidaceae bacterium]
MIDEFKTIKDKSEGTYSELRSKFLAFAHHVTSVDDAMALVEQYQKKYYDARHVCWAYMIGPERETFRSNDNGEPSGTAGKPILGQINSNGLTDIIILVVRYFGGVKLGTSGLIVAYKTAAAEAIANAEIETRTVDEEYTFSFEYPLMNSIMKVARDMDARIINQSYDMDCQMTLSIRRGKMQELQEKIQKALSPF